MAKVTAGKPETIYILELDQIEAELIRSLVGAVGGGMSRREGILRNRTPHREASSRIWSALFAYIPDSVISFKNTIYLPDE